jgi:hypothetical protein
VLSGRRPVPRRRLPAGQAPGSAAGRRRYRGDELSTGDAVGGRFEVRLSPGEVDQVDFARFQLAPTDEPGTPRTV